MRSSLACCRLEARTERPVCPLIEAAFLLEVATLGRRGTWYSVILGITIGPEVPSTLGERRGLKVDVEGTVAGSAVDAEMSTAKARMDGGGAFLSSDFIVRI